MSSSSVKPQQEARPPAKDIIREERGILWPAILQTQSIVPDIFEHQDPGHPQDIIFFEANDTVKDALRILRENRILSAPVYCEEKNRFIGLLDLMDIITFLISKLETTTLPSEKWEELLASDLLNEHIEPLMNVSERNPWITVQEDTPVIDLMTLFTQMNLHRVPVITKDRPKIKAIATNSTVVRWLTSRILPLLPALSLPSVWDVATRQVIQMQETQSTFEAFKKMYVTNVSAIPIVNAQGKLTGTLSMSDIKGIIASENPERDLIKTLRMPIKEYLIKAKSMNLDVELRRLSHQWTCLASDSIGVALRKLAVSGVHRLWVVDGQDKPIGVLSVANVLAAFERL